MPHELDSDGFAIDVLKSVNETIGSQFSYERIEMLSAAEGKVNDSPGVYRVRGRYRSDEAILKVSNSRFPDSVEAEVQKVRLVRGLLPSDCAAVVAAPITDGRFSGRSFAIWPSYRPISDVKIVRTIQKQLLYKSVFAWIRRIGTDSINRNLDSQAIQQQFRLPVQHVCSNRKLSSRVHSVAERALKRLDDGQWLPISILQHTDLHLGNILLPRKSQRRANKFGFFVVDWGGSYALGAPGFDLVAFCRSANVPLQRARTEVMDYLLALSIEPEEFPFGLIVALGLIGSHLNEFPESRYLVLCEDTVGYADSIGLYP